MRSQMCHRDAGSIYASQIGVSAGVGWNPKIRLAFTPPRSNIGGNLSMTRFMGVLPYRKAPRKGTTHWRMAMENVMFGKEGRTRRHCAKCGKNTEWREVRGFVASKNAPVVSQFETQVAWECGACGGQCSFMEPPYCR